MKRTTVAICIPINPQWVASSFLINFLNRLQETPKNIELTINFACSWPVQRARNIATAKALKRNPDYLWWIDTDMALPRGTLERLLSLNKDIVSALVFEKGIPYLPVVRDWKDGKWSKVRDIEERAKQNPILEVGGVGFGSVLIKADVFKKMKPPWFFTEWEKDGLTLSNSEDLYFCKKARELGYKIYVDTKTIAGHHGGLVTELEYLAYKTFKPDKKEFQEYEDMYEKTS